MRIAISWIIVIILIMLILFVPAIILLQIYLSKKKNKWLGLILPFITLAISILVVLGVTLFSVNSVVETIDVNGKIISGDSKMLHTSSDILLTSLYMFILYNIPTGILLIIYKACRSESGKTKEIDRMSIQDLE